MAALETSIIVLLGSATPLFVKTGMVTDANHFKNPISPWCLDASKKFQRKHGV